MYINVLHECVRMMDLNMIWVVLQMDDDDDVIVGVVVAIL